MGEQAPRERGVRASPAGGYAMPPKFSNVRRRKWSIKKNWRSAGGEDTPQAPPGDTDAVVRRGYAVCHWTRAGLTYWAVADVDPEQLETFEDLVTKSG